jgi:hypothetical protein
MQKRKEEMAAESLMLFDILFLWAFIVSDFVRSLFHLDFHSGCDVMK